ncbi:DUF2865 domain-containing protein [Xanthobacter sp. V4C-4]|uniref:DUF2865 domain-containing protein n=1 Tax=Xanthobacter cornucopiae TaxID=3119924 RepID=UPI00372C58F0
MTTQWGRRALLTALCGGLLLPALPVAAQSVGARSFIQGEAGRQGAAGGPARGPARESPPAPARRGTSQREFVALLFGMRGDVATTGSLGGGRERPRILITPAPPAGASAGGSRIAYCVRTCDGRFFPLSGRVAGAADAAAQAQCNAFCPAAEVAVYTSPDLAKGIDGAVDGGGHPYSALPNAFVFRQRLVEGCACTPGGGPAGVARVDVKADVSLRRGDIVVTPEGPRVFAGSRRGPPFRADDFVPPGALPDLPRDLQQRLKDLAFVSD